MKITIRKIFIETTTAGKKRLNRKISIFLFCLILSTVFWLLNALSKDLTMDIQYPCVYENHNNEFVVTNNPPEYLKIFVRGSGFNLLGQALFLKRNPIYVSLLDLNNKVTELSTASLLDDISDQLGSNISVESVYPEIIKVHAERKYSKLVPVVVDEEFSFFPQIRLKSVLVANPPKVLVSGPKTSVDSIDEIHTTNLTDKIEGDVILRNIDLLTPSKSKLLTIKPTFVDLAVEVEQFTETSLVLPININNLPEELNLRTLPSLVTIKFLVSLQLYDVVTEKNFKAYVDYKEVNDQVNRLKVYVEQSNNLVEIIAVSPEKAEFLIKE